MRMVNESREALRRFVSILLNEAREIVALIGVDPSLQDVMADWFSTLRTRTDVLVSFSADDSQPAPEFEYWHRSPLDEALLTASFSEARAIQVLQRIAVISEEVDRLVDALQFDGDASKVIRLIGYVVSDVVDGSRALVRKFPSLDNLDEKAAGT